MSDENAKKRASAGQETKKGPGRGAPGIARGKKKSVIQREAKIALVEEIVGEDKYGKPIIERIVDPEDCYDIVELKSGKKKRNLITKIPRDEFGRVKRMTDRVLAHLELWFKVGCTIGEACTKSGIGRPTLYRYWKTHPDHRDICMEWKKNYLVSDCRLRVAVAVRDEKDTDSAFRVLETQRSDEGWRGSGQTVKNSVQINYSEELKKRAAKYEDPPKKIIEAEFEETD